jgi:hypothetical protein
MRNHKEESAMSAVEQDVGKDYEELVIQAKRIGVADLTEVYKKYSDAMKLTCECAGEKHSPITFTASDKTSR